MSKRHVIYYNREGDWWGCKNCSLATLQPEAYEKGGWKEKEKCWNDKRYVERDLKGFDYASN